MHVPTGYHPPVQDVHQTDTDRQFVCLITCSDEQTVLQPLSKQTRQILSCLQTVCKHWLGICVSKYANERIILTLALVKKLQPCDLDDLVRLDL